MKKGKSLVELAKQIEDVKENSADFVVPTEKLSMKVDEKILDDILDETLMREQAKEDGTLTSEPKRIKTPVLSFENGDEKNFDLNPWSSQQVATYTGIPKQYFDKIATENPDLLADNVNHGLRMQVAEGSRSGKPESRMLRTYRGHVRGFVSAAYRRLDCYGLLETVLPVIAGNGFELESSELTDRRMYLQVVTPRIKAEVIVGDIVQYGLTISSSDVGSGSVRVEPLIFRLRCTNGLITSAHIKKMHIGHNQAGDDIRELLTTETQALSDAAFWSEVKDVVIATMNQDFFDKEVAKLRAAANEKIENFDIPEVVELAAKAVGVTNKETKNSIVAYLANGADGAGLTKWGLANAFTFAANQEHVSYDDAIELERTGSKIIELPKSAWRRISAA